LLLVGTLKPVNITGESNGVYTHVRPPTGYEWVVINLAAYQDSGAAKTCAWFRTPDDAIVGTSGSLNSGEYLPLGWVIESGVSKPGYNPVPLITSSRWLYFLAASIGAGKKSHITGLVLERPEAFETKLYRAFAEKSGIDYDHTGLSWPGDMGAP
jgi:hypothetical protein